MTAKSESKKDAMMTMSADTLAERIRGHIELAENVYKGQRDTYGWAETYIQDAKEFLSELSAAEEAARKEEREACAQIADDYHGRGTVGSPTAKVIAESIRNRE